MSRLSLGKLAADMPVRKAVIPAAGFGTRFLPASKAVPKVLLPVVDRPIIQYAVEELVRAGITHITIVVSRGQEAVLEHFSAWPELEAALEAAGKIALLDEVRSLRDLASFSYVIQHEPLGLGHAVWTARDQVNDEPFAVILPDELFDPADNLLREMVQIFDEHASSVIAVTEVSPEDIRLYGAIEPEDPETEPIRVRSIVEKPEPEKAPSTLASIGRYVLAPEVMDILGKVKPGAGGEIQLTDGLTVLGQRGQLLAMRYPGRRWDVGNKQGFLQATVALAAERPDLGPSFLMFLDGFRQKG